MAVNEALSALSTTSASNTPAGSDSIGTDLDDHLRDIKKNIRFASNHPVQAAKITAYTVVATDHNTLLQVNATASAVTVTLLAAATAGDGFRVGVKRINSATDVTVDGNSSETIDGSTTSVLKSLNQSEWYVCDGSNWHIENDYKESNIAKGSDIASANTLTVGTDGNYFDITGTTQINSFVVSPNREFTLQFDGALVLQHHSSNLDLPSEANITTAAGDVASFFSTGSNTAQCVNYTRADGTSVVSGADIVNDTSPQLGGALDCQGNDITAVGTLKMTEQANAEADTAGAGQIWVDTATPNRFMFTDDAGTDFGISPSFISSEQTVATDTALNVSHGLGAKPKEYTITLICKTGDANYSSGDEIMVNNISHNGSDQGYTSCCDAINVSIIQGEEIQAINKTGFDKSGLTPSNWRWIVRAWL